jgi:hypothetical protein
MNKTAASERMAYAIAFLALLAICLLPIWSMPYLPLLDLSEHVAQATIWANPETYGHTYTIRWFTPYLSFMALCGSLTQLAGPLIAYKITLSLTLLLLPLSLLCLLHSFHTQPHNKSENPPPFHPNWLSLLGFPLSFNGAFHMGFANFCLGVPLSLFTISLLLRALKEPPSGLKITALAFLTLLLFFTHPICTALTLLLYASLLLSHTALTTPPSSFRKKTLCLLVLPLALPLLLSAIWVLNHTAPANNRLSFSLSAHFTPGDLLPALSERLNTLPLWIQGSPWATLPDGDPWRLSVLALATLALCGGAFRRRNTIGLELPLPKSLDAPLLVSIPTLLYLLTPKSLFNIVYVGERLSIYIVCFALLLLPIPKPRASLTIKALFLGSICLCLAHLTPLNPQMNALALQSRQLQRAIEKIPPGSFVSTLPSKDSKNKTTPFFYWPAWVATAQADTHFPFTTATHMPVMKIPTAHPQEPTFILTNRETTKPLGRTLFESGPYKVIIPKTQKRPKNPNDQKDQKPQKPSKAPLPP